MNCLQRIDFNWLRALSYLLETQSVSAAARRAGVGQPAMSRTLAHLRKLFGDPLLVRVGHGSRLTERAEALRPRVVDAVAAIQAALLAPARFDPLREQLEARIAATDYAHTSLVAPWLGHARQLAPGLSVSMQPLLLGSINQLASGDLDFSLGPPVQRPELALERFVVRPVWVDQYMCAMRAGHPSARGRFDLRKFLTLDHVRLECSSMPASCDAALLRLGHERRVVAVVTTFLQALALLSSSDLVAMLPSRLIAAAGTAFRSRALPFDAPGLGLFVAWHPRMTGNARHRWLRESLLAHIERARRRPSGANEGGLT